MSLQRNRQGQWQVVVEVIERMQRSRIRNFYPYYNPRNVDATANIRSCATSIIEAFEVDAGPIEKRRRAGGGRSVNCLTSYRRRQRRG
jgi:hypothetical protein